MPMRRWRRRAAVIAGPATVPLVVGASFSGFLLPWDMLRLWAVIAGSKVVGYRDAFRPIVRSAFVRGAEVSKSTLWRWFVVHTMVLPPLIATVLIVMWTRRRSPTPSSGAVPLDEAHPAIVTAERGVAP